MTALASAETAIATSGPKQETLKGRRNSSVWQNGAHSSSARVPSSRNLLWVVVWVGLGLTLGLWVAAVQGRTAAAEYYAAYLLEKSLSVVNIFVFVIIFSELRIPAEYQRRVLLSGAEVSLSRHLRNRMHSSAFEPEIRSQPESNQSALYSNHRSL